jgi:hypothetical protein
MINGFITLHRAGSFGHRDPDPEASWQRSLAAIDLLLRNWSTLDSQEDS